MKQSLRSILFLLAIGSMTLFGGNWDNVPANAIIKPQPDVRGVDNVDCDLSGTDVVADTLSKVCVIEDKANDIEVTTNEANSKACVLESKVDNLTVEIDVASEFDGTFTLIAEALSKACVIDEKTTDLDEISDSAESKLCVVESKVNEIDVMMDLSEEFNDTFTALNELQSKVCAVEDKTDDLDEQSDETLSKLCVVDSKVDALDVSANFEDEFGGTFTALEKVISKLCVIDETTETVLDVTEESLSKACVIESKIDAIDVSENLKEEFTQVFIDIQESLSKACILEEKETEISDINDDNLSKLCVLESKIDNLDISGTVTEEFFGTYTLLNEAISKLCVVDEKVDEVTNVASQEQSKLDIILSQLDDLIVTVDLKEEFNTTFTLIEAALSKLCVVEDNVDTLDQTTDEVLSKLCVLDSKVDAIDVSDDLSSEFDGTFTMIDDTLSKLCVVEDNLDIAISEVEEIHTQDFGGTFTALDAIFSKVCEINSNVDNLTESVIEEINEQLSLIEDISVKVMDITEIIVSSCDVILEGLSQVDASVDMMIEKSCLIESKVCIIDENVDNQISIIEDIRTEDFGGTFTALDEAISKACIVDEDTTVLDEALDDVFSKLCIIEGIINLGGNTTEDFTGVFTTIEAQISKECVIEDIIDDTEITADDTFSKLCVLNSKLDNLDVSETIASEFDGTFTALDDVLSKMCVVEEKLDEEQDDAAANLSKACIVDGQIDVVTNSSLDLTAEFDGTFTLIAEATSKACAIEPKIEEFTQTADETTSKLCIIESKVEALDVSENVADEFTSLFEKIDDNLSKACVIDDNVDDLNDLGDNTESKICVVESLVDAIDVSDDLSSEFDGTFTMIEQAFDKACIIENTVNTTINTTEFSESKACVIESKVEAIEVSGDLTDEFSATWTVIAAITEKVCAGLCEPILITQDDVPYFISESGTYIVTEDLEYAGYDSIITVSANDVVIDLCNMSLIGSEGATGISVLKDGVTTDRANITIKNGVIRGSDSYYYPVSLDVGIFLDDETHNVLITNVDILDTDSVGIQMGTTAATTPTGLRTALSEVTVKNVRLVRGTDGIVIHRLASLITIDDVHVTGMTNNALATRGESGFEVREVRVHNSTFFENESAAENLLDFAHTRVLDISNCRMNNNEFNTGAVSSSIVLFGTCRKVIFEKSELFCNSGAPSAEEGFDVVAASGTFDSILRELKVHANVGIGGGVRGITLSSCLKILLQDCAAYSNSAPGAATGFLFDSTNNSVVKHCKAFNNSSSTDFAVGFAVLDSDCNIFMDCIANAQSGYIAGVGFLLDTLTAHQFIRCTASCNSTDGFQFGGTDTVTTSECKDCQAMYNGQYGFDLTGAAESVLLIRNIACGNGS